MSISSLDGISFYPNPANTVITIPQMEGMKTLTLTDMGGKVCLERQMSEYTTRVNIENIPSGIYLLRLLKNDGQFFVEKLIIQHK